MENNLKLTNEIQINYTKIPTDAIIDTNINSTELRIYLYLISKCRGDYHFTTKELTTVFNITIKTAKKVINDLIDKGYLTRVGQRKYQYTINALDTAKAPKELTEIQKLYLKYCTDCAQKVDATSTEDIEKLGTQKITNIFKKFNEYVKKNGAKYSNNYNYIVKNYSRFTDKPNSFNNYKGRNYTDEEMAELEENFFK